MKPFTRWSASQVDTYTTCNRKWWFTKILGLEVPQHPSAAIGTEVHAQLEAYLEEKAPVSSLGPIARTALPYAPAPGTVYIEQSIETLGLVAGGLPALGYIDVLDLRSDPPEVLDWKTTSNFRYAKSEDELLRNVQMSVYAKAVLAMCDSFDVPEPGAVRVTHVAMLTKAPHEARRTSALMPLKTIHDNWKTIDSTVLDMRETAVLDTPDKVTPTKSACSAYGGCPFLDRCRALEATRSIFSGLNTAKPSDNSNDDTTETAPMSDAKTSLLARLGVKTKSQTAAPAAPAAPAPEAIAPSTPALPARVPTTVVQPIPGAADALMSRLRESLAKSPSLTAAAPATAPVASVAIQPPDAPSDEAVLARIEQSDAAASAPKEPTKRAAPTAAGAVRRPRNAGPRLLALGYTEAEVEALSNEEMHHILDNNLTPVRMIEEVIERVETAIPVAEDDAVATVSTTITFPAAEVADVGSVYKDGYDEGYQKGYADAEQELKEAIRQETIASLPKTATPVDGLRLYVDCRPANAAGAVELSDFLAPLMAKVAENAKVPHYSMIPYAQGPAQVAALVSVNPPKGVLLADTRLPATNAVLEVLLPYAVEVVRGIR